MSLCASLEDKTSPLGCINIHGPFFSLSPVSFILSRAYFSKVHQHAAVMHEPFARLARSRNIYRPESAFKLEKPYETPAVVNRKTGFCFIIFPQRLLFFEI